MPGLVGIAQRPGSDPIRLPLDALTSALHGEGHAVETRVDHEGRWALGRGHLGILHPQPQLDAAGHVQLVFQGDLHNEPTLRTELGSEIVAPGSGSAATILALYSRTGPQALDRLRGPFCAALVDARRRELILVNDVLGTFPLYWFCDRHRFVFASRLSTVLRCPGTPRAISAHAMADYLAVGMVLGDKTLADGVQLLAPGTILTYSWDTGVVSHRRLCSIADFFGEGDSTKDLYLENVCQAFNDAVARSVRGPHRYGVSLSGGLDSRTILSALTASGTKPGTYTLGIRGCADEVIAGQLARIAGTPHRFFELDERYLREFLPNLRAMVSLTDGMYLSHGLTEMLALGFLRQAGFEVLLRGHAGEVAKMNHAWPVHTDQHVDRMAHSSELPDYLLRRANYVSSGVSLTDLFTEDWHRQVRGRARQSLEESLQQLELSPANACAYLYLTEHHRRCTIASLEIFRGAVEVRMPFADEQFLRALLAGQPSWRQHTEIHSAIVRRNDPRLLRIRNSNTGAPADAGALSQFILDHCNSVLKRFNIYGYRHYHDFDSWMKRMLLDSVEAVLLHPDTIRRGIFREPTLRRLLHETKTGAADHAYLLQLLLILELWQQENVSEAALAVY